MAQWKQIAAAKAVLSRETGTVRKDHGGKLRVALAYPNRSVGMSSLALQILTGCGNAAHRVRARLLDEQALAAGLPLVSLESGLPSPVRCLGLHRLVRDGLLHVAAMLRHAGCSRV